SRSSGTRAWERRERPVAEPLDAAISADPDVAFAVLEECIDDSGEQSLLLCIYPPDRIGRADLAAANRRRIEQPPNAAALRADPETALAIENHLRGAAHDLADRPCLSDARDGVRRAVGLRKPDRAVLRLGKLTSLGGQQYLHP